MIYIICTIKQDKEKVILYRIYDTCSGSVMLVSPELLTDIISNNRGRVVNARIQNNNIIIKEWVNGIATEEYVFNSDLYKINGPKYVIISTEGNTCKLIGLDGRETKLEIKNLKSIEKTEKIANYSTGQIEDAYKIHKDAQFDESIKSKYKGFIAKTIILGYRNITFEYEIENSDVRLKKYTGLNDEVILPSFITAIKQDAFKGKGIKAIKLNHGLKVIGEWAFYTDGSSSGLERIEIPETVEIIGDGAFMGNHILARADGTPNKDRFKLLSNKTVVLDQHL